MKWLRILVLSSVVLTGCFSDEPESSPMSQRGVASLIAGSSAKAPPILSVEGVQESVGSPRGLGPVDYEYFGLARMKREDIDAYLRDARPMPQRPAYFRPAGDVAWWPNEQAFNDLAFFEHPTPSPGVYGWVAVSKGANTIYFALSTT